MNNTYIKGIICNLKEVEEAASLCGHIIITTLLSHPGVKFCQRILRFLPMNWSCLTQC